MKLIKEFSDFLESTVNLNKTRLETLDGNVGALKSFVENSDWQPNIREWLPQGSWAHETIIKPVDLGEFDADLLVMVDPIDGWSAADYVRELGKVFKASDRYADKVHVWDYCVTITYASEQMVDIAPCVVAREYQGVKEVCNKSADEFEESCPEEYTAWLIDKNRISKGNGFRKATRLLKYLRDIKRRFSCSSVLLTTLLGYQVEDEDKNTAGFADVPSTLQTLVGRLDDYLQANPSKPRVENPHLRSEDFAASLTSKRYRNLRKSIRRYRKWVDNAIEAETYDESVKAWRRLFGDQFARVVTEQANALVVKADAPSYKNVLFSSGAHLSALVDQVIRFGVSTLPVLFNRPPYLQEPDWEIDIDSDMSVIIRASAHATQVSQGTAVSSGQPLFPSGYLRFEARDGAGNALGDAFRTEWRVTNTGDIAFKIHSRRGDFYPSEPTNHIRWEPLSFRGVHFVEAFVIRKADEMQMAKSEPYYVVLT